MDYSTEGLPAGLLSAWGLGADSFALKSFARNLGFFSRADQQRLARSRVAIAGMGGVGGIHLITLVRAGIGAFHIADFDRFEPANFNRQYGARVETLGQEKTEVLKRDALQINPFLDVRVFKEGVHEKNVDEFLNGADVFLDGLDFFAPAVRRLLFRRARELKIPAVTAGPIGFGTSALVFQPDGISFDDYFDLRDDQTELQQLLRFLVGIIPQPWFKRYTLPQFGVRLNSKSAPSISIGCLMASAVASTEVLRLLLQREGIRAAPGYFQMDGYCGKMKRGIMRWGNRGPLQRLKIFLGERGIAQRERLFRSRPNPPTWKGAGPIPEDVVSYLLEAGLQAPSGDNLQPWSFAVEKDVVHLGLENSDPSFFNADGRAAVISLGMVAENIRIAATGYGLDTRLHEPTNPINTPIRLTFAPAGRLVDPLADVLWERVTNRRLYEPKAIPDYSLAAMTEAAKCRNAELHWATEPNRRTALGEMAYWADRARVVIKECHEPLYAAFRNNADEAREKGDGFSYGNLLVRVDQRLFLKITRPWAVMKIANRIGLGNMIAKTSKASVHASAGIGLLMIPDNSPLDSFRGGLAFERVWLTATLHGLTLQPMASLPFFWEIWKSQGEAAFPKEARPHILKSIEILRSVFPGIDFEQKGLLMLFRTGFAADIPEGTFRKPLKTFLKPLRSP
ncbi:MAG: ThiF family adenylyltransferase [Elusimicrobia bacterium]|nr:ThiF family adenylyltransferase [Elusimicrobiota bacterium]